MNYEEEQQGEIEALESIYFGEINFEKREPLYKFSISVQTEGTDIDGTESGLKCALMFEYTPHYPEDVPLIEVQDAEGFENVEDLTNHLMETAEDLKKEVMIFTLVSAAQEWLNTRWDQMKHEQQEVEIKRKEAEEEAERKRFEGTRVTVEAFLNWKREFDAEREKDKKKEKEEKDSKKLTGKELFLQDKTLNESDLKFLEEGDNVVVDEALFEDLDELDLEDEDDLEDS